MNKYQIQEGLVFLTGPEKIILLPQQTFFNFGDGSKLKLSKHCGELLTEARLEMYFPRYFPAIATDMLRRGGVRSYFHCRLGLV